MKRRQSKVVHEAQPANFGKHLFFKVRNQFIHISCIKLVRHIVPSEGADGIKREYVIKLDESVVEGKFSTVWASKEEAKGLVEWLEGESK